MGQNEIRIEKVNKDLNILEDRWGRPVDTKESWAIKNNGKYLPKKKSLIGFETLLIFDIALKSVGSPLFFTKLFLLEHDFL
jgi:hypothetical protein